MAPQVTARGSAQIGGELRGLTKKLPSSHRLFENLNKEGPAISLEDAVTEEGHGGTEPRGGYGCCDIPPWNGYPVCGGS